MMSKVASLLVSLLALVMLSPTIVLGFAISPALTTTTIRSPSQHIQTFDGCSNPARFGIRTTTVLFAAPDKSKLSKLRREKMGIEDDEEYDISVAIDANTDSTISKILAGSLIVVVIGLLVVAVVIPSFQDYGGQCNPILTQGRC